MNSPDSCVGLRKIYQFREMKQNYTYRSTPSTCKSRYISSPRQSTVMLFPSRPP